MKKSFNLPGKKKKRHTYIPYTDSTGHLLKAEEIGFVNEEMLDALSKTKTADIQVSENDENDEDDYWTGILNQKPETDEKSSGKKEEPITVNSEGVVWEYDDSGDFPVAARKNGVLYPIKISINTREVLPQHAGCCHVIDIVYAGAPSAAKTVLLLQMVDPAFHDMISRDSGIAFRDDLPKESHARKRYTEKLRNLKDKHTVPDPTLKGEKISPYVFYVIAPSDEGNRHMLLKLQDFAGEGCMHLDWNDEVFNHNRFFLLIGAEEIIKSQKGETVAFTKVVDQLISKLNIVKNDNYNLDVIISKADLLQGEEDLADAFFNSIEMRKGKLYRKTHSAGFDKSQAGIREACVRDYFEDSCPNVYNSLVRAVPAGKITFRLIASLGEEPVHNKFENYRPFCIDEPILSALADEGMFPVINHTDRSEPVPGATSENGFWGNIWKDLKDSVTLNDEFGDDYDGLADVKEGA